MIYNLLIGILILDSLLLGTVVLLQSGKGGGLAAMGGANSTDSFLGGRQATTILTKMSWWCGGLFLGISLILAMMSSNQPGTRSVLEGQIEAPAPATQLPLEQGVPSELLQGADTTN